MRALRNPPWLLIVLLSALVTASCGSSGGTADGADNENPSRPAGGGAEPASDPAPELAGIDGWHNSEPLTLDGLRGSPVLLVFFRDT